MVLASVFAFVIAAAIILILLFFYFPAWKNQRIRSRPFPQQWHATLIKNLPIYQALKQEEQKQLQQLIHLFIATKIFEGCAGLEITEEIKVTIAAEACLLVLNQNKALYPKLYSILVYPYSFKAERKQADHSGVISTVNQHMLGESWSNGKVILSWNDVLAGVEDFNDGQNVVLHEFAHQLDSESGSTNGAPPLRRNSYKSWATVLSGEFEQLQTAHTHNKQTIMDQYGASNPAEFFAVATETFFEKPQQLYKNHRELFEELQQYYQIDPRDWEQQASPITNNTST